MPRVVKLYKKSKSSLKHNEGPESPITRKDVERAGGSLEQVYRTRAAYGDPFSMDVVERVEKTTGKRKPLTR